MGRSPGGLWARVRARVGARSRPPAEVLLRPIQQFVATETSGGLLLLACTLVALVWANSPWAPAYTALWETKLTVGLGSASLSKPLLYWINEGLMAIFFFVVGLEIKREALAGELAAPKQAALPIAAAVGGMLVPAALYTLLNVGGAGAAGWGIPMATDIAFALGVLSLLGERVPPSLKVFLTSLAIVDDLGAVLVIAIFYSGGIAVGPLLVVAALVGVLFALNLLGVRSVAVFGLLGVALWVAVLQTGVHATIAGVLLAITIPSRARIDSEQFLQRGRRLLEEFRQGGYSGLRMFSTERHQSALGALGAAASEFQVLSQRLETALHPFVALLVMPVFALANAGVALGGHPLDLLRDRVTLGVLVGLVLGKQAGIWLFAWVAVRLGWATLPSGVRWRQLYGVAWLGGIGFTMSLFIADLAFGGTLRLAEAKLGILVASLIAGTVGWLLLRRLSPIVGRSVAKRRVAGG